MATQIDTAGIDSSAKTPETHNPWTDLQQIQHMMGLWDGIDEHLVKPRELPEWTWAENDEWRKAKGMLADHPEHDTSASRKAERKLELAHDEAKFDQLFER